MLTQMGFKDEAQVQQFLAPQLKSLPHPLGMKGMKEAVKTIVEAIEQGTEIIIWGDYDVDGTTGTSLLVNYFRELGIEPHWRIPNRLTEGYGLNLQAFKDFLESLHCTQFLLITVDCGISNSEEVKGILSLGGTVIVTDHHQVPLGNLPDCVILNANQKGCGFVNYKLAGVGVAFYLAAALRTALENIGYFKDLKRPNMKEYLGFVALGTIADLVDITPENRILIRAGMEALTETTLPGLEALLDSAGLKVGPLTSEDISFSLGPRINAAGRLGSADVAVDLMTCDNPTSGAKLSKRLDGYNEKRKIICDDNLETALNNINRYNDADSHAIVVAGEFHSGVIGIVASKIVDIYKKPTIVFARETDDNGEVSFKGSGRSVEGINLLGCLNSCADQIEKFGGHEMAAGLTVTEKYFKAFAKDFNRQVEIQKINNMHMHKTKGVVVECNIDEVMSEETLKYLMKFEPFGPGNEKPVFMDPEADVVSCKAIGGNSQHIQVTIRGSYMNYRGVGFGLGDKYEDIRRNPHRQITFSPMINRYRGVVDWQLRIVDI